MNGRFVLNRSEGKLMGVAAGLADYTNIDPADPSRAGRSAAPHRTGRDPVLCSYRMAGLGPLIRASLPYPPPCDRSSSFSASLTPRRACSKRRLRNYGRGRSRATGYGSSSRRSPGSEEAPPLSFTPYAPPPKREPIWQLDPGRALQAVRQGGPFRATCCSASGLNAFFDGPDTETLRRLKQV